MGAEPRRSNHQRCRALNLQVQLTRSRGGRGDTEDDHASCGWEERHAVFDGEGEAPLVEGAGSDDGRRSERQDPRVDQRDALFAPSGYGEVSDGARQRRKYLVDGGRHVAPGAPGAPDDGY